jgi:predicted aspartyl protease
VRRPYDESYVPPAPALDIVLAAPGEPFLVGPIPGLIDTGADTSIVPSRFLDLLPVQIDSQRLLRGYGGIRRSVDVYIVDVGIGTQRFPGVEIVADDIESDVIIGRNVLNRLRITLDGPGRGTDVSF